MKAALTIKLHAANRVSIKMRWALKSQLQVHGTTIKSTPLSCTLSVNKFRVFQKHQTRHKPSKKQTWQMILRGIVRQWVNQSILPWVIYWTPALACSVLTQSTIKKRIRPHWLRELMLVILRRMEKICHHLRSTRSFRILTVKIIIITILITASKGSTQKIHATAMVIKQSKDKLFKDQLPIIV